MKMKINCITYFSKKAQSTGRSRSKSVPLHRQRYKKGSLQSCRACNATAHSAEVAI